MLLSEQFSYTGASPTALVSPVRILASIHLFCLFLLLFLFLDSLTHTIISTGVVVKISRPRPSDTTVMEVMISVLNTPSPLELLLVALSVLSIVGNGLPMGERHVGGLKDSSQSYYHKSIHIVLCMLLILTSMLHPIKSYSYIRSHAYIHYYAHTHIIATFYCIVSQTQQHVAD